jgi:PPP family 3-phenylpropionic acid transporter
VVAEIVVMVVLRHRVNRIDPYLLMRIGAAGAIVRWVCMGLTTDPLLLLLIQPLHAMSFTLSYLASLRIIAEVTPRHLAATAQTVYSALGYSGPTGVMLALVSWLYPSWGGGVFFLMAAMVVLALPFLWPRDRVPSL